MRTIWESKLNEYYMLHALDCDKHINLVKLPSSDTLIITNNTGLICNDIEKGFEPDSFQDEGLENISTVYYSDMDNVIDLEKGDLMEKLEATEGGKKKLKYIDELFLVLSMNTTVKLTRGYFPYESILFFCIVIPSFVGLSILYGLQKNEKISKGLEKYILTSSALYAFKLLTDMFKMLSDQ